MDIVCLGLSLPALLISIVPVSDHSLLIVSITDCGVFRGCSSCSVVSFEGVMEHTTRLRSAEYTDFWALVANIRLFGTPSQSVVDGSASTLP